jgi:hypothetical protein
MRNPRMTTARRFVSGSFVLAMIAFASACVVETPREGYHEGYWDHDHNRYWHNHGWAVCDAEHCR